MLMMARSIIHLEECLKSIRDTPVKRKGEREVWVESIPEDEDFTLMKKVVRNLTIFETVSTMMQSETKPTICHVISQLVKACFMHNLYWKLSLQYTHQTRTQSDQQLIFFFGGHNINKSIHSSARLLRNT